MPDRVTVDQLADAITMALREYTDDVTVAIEATLDETSNAVLTDTRSNSPIRTGRYKKGWRRTKESSGGRTKYTIHNKTDYQRVHLLEKGHAKRNGGRVAARPHLVPAYDAHAPQMEERIKEILKNGG